MYIFIDYYEIFWFMNIVYDNQIREIGVSNKSLPVSNMQNIQLLRHCRPS